MKKRLCFLTGVLLLVISTAGILFSSDIIEDDAQGAAAFAEARALLSSLGVSVDREILLKVRPREEVQVHYCSTSGRGISVGGYYQPYDPETIWIISGQKKTDTIGDMVHELTHAWQSTNAPLQDPMISEGFAMWCEVKVLLMLGDKSKALQCMSITDPDYGGGLRMYLDIEKKGGIPAVLEYARTATKAPEKK